MTNPPTAASHLASALPWHRCLWRDPGCTLRRAGTLGLGLWIAWSVGAADFGFLQAAFAMALILSSLTALGIEEAVRSDLSAKPAETTTILGTSMALRGVAGALGFLVLVLFAPHDPDLKRVWLVMGLLAITQTPLTLAWWFEAGSHRRVVQIALNVSFGVMALFLVVLLWRGAATVWFAAALVLEQPVYALIIFGAHLKIAPYEDTFTWDWPLARRWLKTAAKPLGLALLPFAIVPLNQLLALWLTAPEKNGEFALAARFYEFGLFVVLAILVGRNLHRPPETDSSTVSPSLVPEYHAAAKLGWIVALITSIVSVILTLTVLRADYRDALWTTILLSLALVPAAIGWVRDEGFRRSGFSAEATRLQLIGAFLNLPLAAVGIHFLGAVGAALATTLSLGLTNLFATRFSKAAANVNAGQWRALFLADLWQRSTAPVVVNVDPVRTSTPPFSGSISSLSASEVTAAMALSRPTAQAAASTTATAPSPIPGNPVSE